MGSLNDEDGASCTVMRDLLLGTEQVREPAFSDPSPRTKLFTGACERKCIIGCFNLFQAFGEFAGEEMCASLLGVWALDEPVAEGSAGDRQSEFLDD